MYYVCYRQRETKPYSVARSSLQTSGQHACVGKSFGMQAALPVLRHARYMISKMSICTMQPMHSHALVYSITWQLTLVREAKFCSEMCPE